jgi:hypothetical protein
MGNFFESDIKEPTNRARANSVIQPDQYLTTEERKRVATIYSSLSSTTVSYDANNFLEVWGLKYPLFSNLLYCWALNHIKCLNDFEIFVIEMTRMPADAIVHRFWDMISENAQIKPGEKYRMIFSVLMELGDAHYTLQEIMPVTDRVCSWFAIISARQNPEFDPAIHNDYSYLLNLIHSYVPHFSKVIESHFSRVLFPDLSSPSGNHFRCPRLTGAFDRGICKDCDLFPLALYTDGLQGIWHRLYSSNEDGFSFNRIEHALIGYNVSWICLHYAVLIYIYTGYCCWSCCLVLYLVSQIPKTAAFYFPCCC